MAGPRTRRARGPRVSLSVQGVGQSEDEPQEVRAPTMPWQAAAVMGAALCALASWLVVTAPVVVATLSGAERPLSSAFRLGTQLWLLGHGAGARLGTTTLTLMPLGLTLVIVLLCSGVAGFAARQAQLSQPDDLTPTQVQHVLGRILMLFTGAYAVVVAVVSFLLADPDQTARALWGAFLLALGSSLAGAGRTLGWEPWLRWPAWARLVPSAVAAGVLTALVAAAVALTTALVQGRGRIAALTAALGPDPVGAVVLMIGQLAYLPNLLLWSVAWVTGSGIALGDASLVSPAATQLGLLPGIPVLGAVPEPSAGRWVLLLWLAGGAASGAVSAVVAVAPRRRARMDETALVGGLAGVVTGVALTALVSVSRGALGVARMTALGPRMPELFVLSCSLLGISGVVTGLVMGLWAWARGRGHDDPGDGEEDVTRTLSRPAPGDEGEATAPVG